MLVYVEFPSETPREGEDENGEYWNYTSKMVSLYHKKVVDVTEYNDSGYYKYKCYRDSLIFKFSDKWCNPVFKLGEWIEGAKEGDKCKIVWIECESFTSSKLGDIIEYKFFEGKLRAYISRIHKYTAAFDNFYVIPVKEKIITLEKWLCDYATEGAECKVVNVNRKWDTKVNHILVYKGTYLNNKNLGERVIRSTDFIKGTHVSFLKDETITEKEQEKPTEKEQEKPTEKEQEKEIEMTTENKKNVLKDALGEVFQSAKEGAKLSGSAEAAELMVETLHKLVGKAKPEIVVFLKKGGENSKHAQALVLAVLLKLALSLYPNLPYSEEASKLSGYVVEFETAKLLKPLMTYAAEFTKALVASAGHLVVK